MLGSDDMITCAINVGLNFEMSTMLAELIETMQVLTVKYNETCFEKKISTKFDCKGLDNKWGAS